MSRDLSFWKTSRILNKNENKKIYKELSQGRYLDCVDEIPNEEILVDLRNTFKEWKIYDNNIFEKDESSFQLMINKQFVRVDCYSMSEFDMNQIIDIMFKYGCPLYDSSIDVRFDEWCIK